MCCLTTAVNTDVFVRCFLICRDSSIADHHGAPHPQISTFQPVAFLRTVSRHVHLHRAFDRERRALGRGRWHSVCMVVVWLVGWLVGCVFVGWLFGCTLCTTFSPQTMTQTSLYGNWHRPVLSTSMSFLHDDLTCMATTHCVSIVSQYCRCHC